MFFHHGDINLNQETPKNAIESRLGTFSLWRAVWDPGNWINLRASRPWVFRQEAPRKDTTDTLLEEPYAHDGDHMLLFPEDPEGLCPRAWVEAAWPFLEHFRSNFGFHLQEAFIYTNVTLIGHPLGTRHGIGQDVEEELKKANWRRVERIWCTSAEELATVLQHRVENNVRFAGEDELAPSQPS